MAVADTNVRPRRQAPVVTARGVRGSGLARLLLQLLELLQLDRKLFLLLAASLTPACIIPVGPNWQDPPGERERDADDRFGRCRRWARGAASRRRSGSSCRTPRGRPALLQVVRRLSALRAGNLVRRDWTTPRPAGPGMPVAGRDVPLTAAEHPVQPARRIRSWWPSRSARSRTATADRSTRYRGRPNTDPVCLDLGQGCAGSP